MAWWRVRSSPARCPGSTARRWPTARTGRVDGAEPPAPIARDVEIGRRLYRSGESEYLIDGHAVRLRDVQDILMDVGVGVKGYAVIEQGKIGQILSSKPTDRRQLIEEAAGVTKFKSRRRQAELKLEAAQQNLTRVDDLVYELERQRAALKRQAGKARRYQRLRGELRRWEKLLFAQRYERLTDAIRTAREALTAVREREQVAAARLAEVESDLERVRIELTEAEGQANGLRAEAHQRELENERRQQQITFDQQQAASLVQTVQEIAGELAHLEARRGPAREEIEARRAAAPGRQRRTGRRRRGAAQRDARPRGARDARSGRSIATSTRPGAAPPSTCSRRRRCSTRSSAPRKAGSASAASSDASTSKPRICASRSSA